MGTVVPTAKPEQFQNGRAFLLLSAADWWQKEQCAIINEIKLLCFIVLILIRGGFIPPMTGNLISICAWYLTPLKQRLKAKVNWETQYVS